MMFQTSQTELVSVQTNFKMFQALRLLGVPNQTVVSLKKVKKKNVNKGGLTYSEQAGQHFVCLLTVHIGSSSFMPKNGTTRQSQSRVCLYTSIWLHIEYIRSMSVYHYVRENEIYFA